MPKRRGRTKRAPLSAAAAKGRSAVRRRGPRVSGSALAAGPRVIGHFTGWKLEDAKARFSEVVRRARSEGPQRVTVRGKDAVVIISADELDQLLPGKKQLPFVPFMESLHVEGLDLSREPDYGRDVEL
jgi:antitoxin Phd